MASEEAKVKRQKKRAFLTSLHNDSLTICAITINVFRSCLPFLPLIPSHGQGRPRRRISGNKHLAGGWRPPPHLPASSFVDPEAPPSVRVAPTFSTSGCHSRSSSRERRVPRRAIGVRHCRAMTSGRRGRGATFLFHFFFFFLIYFFPRLSLSPNNGSCSSLLCVCVCVRFRLGLRSRWPTHGPTHA